MERPIWIPLQISNSSRHVPQLLIKASFNADSYSIFVTDLCHIWSEELNKSEIVERASNTDTSIEVTRRDTSQLRLLLENIAKSLKDFQNVKRRLLHDNEDGLILRTTISLPEPLDALHWSIHLKCLTSDDLKRELILPLLASSYVQHQHVKSLISIIEHKDQAISKLLHELESSGIDLSAAFPSLSGARSTRKVIKQDYAAQHIPGLGAFDENKWRQTPISQEQIKASLAEVMQGLLPEPDMSTLRHLKERSGEQWWTHLQENLNFDDDVMPKLESSDVMEGVAASEGEEGDSEFQTQPTPPQLRILASASNNQQRECTTSVVPEQYIATDEDETTEDDDLDAPLSKLIPRVPPKNSHDDPGISLNIMHQVKNAQRVGSTEVNPKGKFTVGGPKPQKVKQLKAQSNPLPKHSLDQDTTDDETADEKAEPASPVSTTSGAAKPARVGFMIGGKLKAQGQSKSVTPIASTPPLARETVDRSISLVSNERLSENISIGGHGRSTKESTEARRAATPPESVEGQVERRRKELKRELEAKNDALAKKKLRKKF
ncbi:XLF-domain-containing protein [Lepidopterella palustris CBS 459.81]|uniref:Non-homologous end-joining factor 1 n=1 Tax=Lepidopterella palustris CBS 459.81 TaxID=1314670 RepID=A0A8E2JI58_9PEZI|nr:XLF-domain-containing protein [Lepidopterella palustris CBS 459.81]